MTNITAAMVKELREKTGAGMMDCKKALGETGGDLEAANDWLRAKGIAKAANKSARTATEGVIALAVDGVSKAALVEVNSETDFVARNTSFQEISRLIARTALSADGDVEKLKALPCGDTGGSVSSSLSHLIATIGENMTVRRTCAVEQASGVVGSYLHGQVADGLGKIGVLVSLHASNKSQDLVAFARQLAMHIAAAHPLALTLSDISEDVLAREKAILIEKNQGKPPHVVEKIVESGLKSFGKEHCLLEQSYIHSPNQSVQNVLEEIGARLGTSVTISQFVRYQLGEGIEKVADDFAAEVAKVAASA